MLVVTAWQSPYRGDPNGSAAEHLMTHARTSRNASMSRSRSWTLKLGRLAGSCF